MNWREAFLRQARSDYAVFQKLGFDVPQCQRLHYLQMACEKLAEAHLCDPSAPSAPKRVHRGFVDFLRLVSKNPTIYGYTTGFRSPKQFKKSVEGLLPLAEKLEKVTPAGANKVEVFKGWGSPNLEYPWRANSATLNVIAPADHYFVDFAPETPKLRSLLSLLHAFLKPE